MTTSPKTNDSLLDKANAAFEQVVIKVIERARQTGTSIIVWEDGQVREISPDEMQVRTASTRKQ